MTSQVRHDCERHTHIQTSSYTIEVDTRRLMAYALKQGKRAEIKVHLFLFALCIYCCKTFAWSTMCNVCTW